MAYSKPEYPPLLSAGLHAKSLEDLKKLCVDPFPDSPTREDIMAGLEAIYERARALGMPGDMWINGSFLTKKTDPNDVDILFLFPQAYHDDGTSEQKEFVSWLTSNESDPKHSFRCDTYAEPIINEDDSDYPLHIETMEHYRDKVFGFAVNSGEPKGIAVVALDEVSA